MATVLSLLPSGGPVFGILRWRPADWRGLNNKSECCQYTSYNKLCYTHNHHHHQQSTCYCGGGGGGGGNMLRRERRDTTVGCLGKI